MSPIVERTIRTPVGPLRLVATETALVAVLFPGDPVFLAVDADRPRRHVVLDQAERELAEYFAGTRRVFEVKTAATGTDFQVAVWHVLAKIPYGARWSYGDVARKLRRPTATRAVGGANHRNPISIIVPCHRVVGADGRLTGYGGGLERKQWLLDHEQAVIARG
jgi:methylated-DNA-[protein]-cysteine S-methyltransferase